MNEIAARLASRLFDCRVIQNQYRSAFVVAMIEPFLAQTGWRYAGDSWGGWDFERNEAERLEVKQSAAHQTWSEARQVQTRGSFDIAPRTGYWSENGSKWMASPGRCAQVYVFAWNGIHGPNADHREPDQWEFYVIPAILLPSNQRTISLSRIRAMRSPVSIAVLSGTVEHELGNRVGQSVK